ncbi:MAG: hypothetical protein ACP5VE_11435 [Chthonomonadales bacterium]
MCLAHFNLPLRPAFTPPPKHYNYAPCFVQVPGQLHVWYCANLKSGNVTDAICHRRALWSRHGWAWGPETVALQPAQGRLAWDCRHVCDPEVVGGYFRFRGKRWRYLLLYLGTNAEASTHNQVGAALADSLEGPWHRYPRPIIPYTSAASGGIVGEAGGWLVYRFWGVGQPSAISLDGRGRLLIFYSRGEEASGEEMLEADLSDLDRGPLVGSPVQVPGNGIRSGREAISAPVNNVGIARGKDRYLYMVCDGPLHTDGRKPDFISAEVGLFRIKWRDLRRRAGRWERVAVLDAASTGWPRNHNACILKDLLGRVPMEHRISLGVSVAEAYEVLPSDAGWLWSYRVVLLDPPAADGRSSVGKASPPCPRR